MRALKILFAVFFVVAVAATAMATTSVTLNGITTNCTGPMTLNDMTVTDGNVSLTVTCSGSGCTNHAPVITVTNPPTTATVGTALNATFSVTDQDGQTPTVNPNVGSISGTNWSWTPTVAGTQVVTLTANDGQSCNNLATYSWSVNVASSGGGTGGGSGTQIPAGQQVKDTIPSLGEKDYYFNLGSSSSKITVYLNTQDWSTNQDMYVSTSAQPKCSGTQVSPVWSNVTPDNNETIWMYIAFPANTTFYVTVCNRSTTNGAYKVYWSQN